MTKQDPTLIVERLHTANLNALEALFHAVYGRTVDANFFTKKYETGYSGIEYIGYIACTTDQKPVAFIGAVPCHLHYDGKIFLSAQLTDGMTHPGYRKRGLFVMLIEKTIELCRQNNIRLLFGFPNQNSLPAFLNKLGWKIYENLDHFSLPVSGWPLEKISRKLPFLKAMYRRYQYRVLSKYVQDISFVHDTWFADQDTGVYRTWEYLQYKSRDTFFIAIQQALVWIKISHGLLIGDISVPEKDFDTVMHTLTGIAKKLGVDKISFHCSAGMQLHRLFSGKYCSDPSFPVIWKDLGSEIPSGKIKFTYADIDIF